MTDAERTYFLQYIKEKVEHTKNNANRLEAVDFGNGCIGFFENDTLLYVDIDKVFSSDSNDIRYYMNDIKRVYFDAPTDCVYVVQSVDEQYGHTEDMYYYDGMLFRLVIDDKIYDGMIDGWDYWQEDVYQEMYKLCKGLQEAYK